MLVKETQVALNQRMDEVLRPLGLSVSQYACLQTLSDTPGITGSELARRVFVSRQAMNVLLQGLERRKLVLRSTESGPRGERGTVLTRAATALVGEAGAAVSEVVAAMTAGLAGDETARLHTLLTTCRDALRSLRPVDDGEERRSSADPPDWKGADHG